jgi:hypothetical protein
VPLEEYVDAFIFSRLNRTAWFGATSM